MNRGINYWVSFSFTHPSSLHTKVKFVKKNRSRKIASTRRKQTLITSISLGLLQQNKGFPTPLEQANKMISKVLLLVPSFTKKQTFKKFADFKKYCASISPNVFNALYCKFRLCRVFTDPVTYRNYVLCVQNECTYTLQYTGLDFM